MFNEHKMLQIITLLLSLNGGRMNKLKLMKELYLIDRASIEERNISVSGDEFFSLPHGPILSQTLNMINDIPHDNPWGNYLKIDGYDIVMLQPFDEGRLSKKDKEYIKAISKQYAEFSQFAIRDFTHTLPEWSDPAGSNRKIPFRDIMKALGKDEAETECAKQEYDSITGIYKMLGIQ